MAMIESFKERDPHRMPKVHGLTKCTYFHFSADGKSYLQLDTWGSANREFTNQPSQQIQLDEKRARALVAIIRHQFPSIE